MISTPLRSLLLATSALGLLAACSGSGEVASSGSAGPVTIGDGGGNGGGETGPDVSFVPEGFSCPTGTTASTVTSGSTEVEACVIAQGTVTQDLTLPGTASGQRVGYILEGGVFIGENVIENPSGASATLTVGAGAILMGRSGSDALFITPGSRIEVEGTAAQPVVMTSLSDAADGSVDDGLVGGSASQKAEWGGLVISGLAPINDCDLASAAPGSADCTKTGEGGSGSFGGGNATDDSGSLTYLRVQYAGFAFNDEDELNGIAFQGVGSGTEVSYVQVHNGFDDGVEFFGGRVNVDHLVITGAGDDSIDWTDGWRGEMQYALVVQDDVRANRGMEGDNRGNDVNVGEAEGVRSFPVISNFTLFGSAQGDVAAPEADDGMKLRAGTDGLFANGIVIGFTQGVDYDKDNDIEDDSGNVIRTETASQDPALYSIFTAANTADPFDGDAASLFNASGNNNQSANAETVDGVIPGAAELAVPATTVATISAASRTVGLDDTDYIGAFDPDTESNSSNWTTGWTLSGTIPGAAAAGCPAGTTLSSTPVPAGRTEQQVCDMPNEVLFDLTLTAGSLYRLNGPTFVGTDGGPDPEGPLATSAASATLTVDPGVTVFGTSGETAIIVNRGSQLVARGTRGAPIIFTSQQDALGTGAPGRQQFGGLVLNGRARINDCDEGENTPGTAECVKTGEGGSGLFGGNDDEDSSGALEYVVVRYAGFPFNEEDELNGIAFQGVGSGTTVSYVQVDQGFDDGVEFFGGTVNVDHLVITAAGDDSIDWTDGFRGSVQYALVVQADDLANNGIEADNRGNDTNVGDAEGVRSFPTIANFTMFGSSAGGAASPNAGNGMLLRAGTDGILANGIVTGFVDGISFVRQETGEDASTANPEFFALYTDENTGAAVEAQAAGLPTATNITTGTTDGDDGLDGFIPTSTITSIMTPVAVSDLTGANEAVEDALFIGAFDPATETDASNWATGWTVNLSTDLANVADQ
ncbi:hypothetical protein [Parvularcula dongshanensis]|uniref:Lipoprotein n=1 Tax=Parvularcula dongshanensis TaxID=1173995 RepID=A0A840I0C7_9PROT|nr:hypothetical protein [Parvularcula dongshanensis]MBB4657628.1 hypothetical protein [Parvularcula dongshanensis]